MQYETGKRANQPAFLFPQIDNCLFYKGCKTKRAGRCACLKGWQGANLTELCLQLRPEDPGGFPPWMVSCADACKSVFFIKPHVVAAQV